MASSKNLIQSLRSAHDPHFKLEGRVGGLEKGMGVEVAKLHKTLSKSFVLQRKTLARVLGLESRVNVLESQEEVIENVIEDELDVDIPREASETPAGEREVGGDEPSRGVSTLIDPPKKIKAKRKKIKAADIKKGTALDKDFGSRVMGQDDKGGYLSKEERIARFKGEKFDPESVKPADESESESESQGESGGGSKAEKVLSAIAAPISSIADTVDSIFNTLKEQFDEQKDTKEDARIKNEQVDAKKDEKSLEKGGLKKGLEKTSAKALAPFQSIWSKLVNFLTTILFGKVVMKVLDWFGNPENAERVKSFVRFLKDWWPVLLAGIMAFLPALLGPGGMILGTIVLVAWALPKIMDAVKWLGTLPDKIGKFLTGGDAELDKAEKDATSELEADVSKAESESGIEPPPEPIELNKGGEVPGAGNKDTVPAMLTPGEFVMSKGAVQQYGIDTLEGMNAAAGGTNIPTVMGGYNGGGMSKKQQIMRQTDSVGTFGEAGSSISTSQATPEEMKEKLAAMGMPSMELWDGSVVPNFGKMGADSFMTGIQMVREGMADHPDKIKQLDEFMETNPYAQPEKLQSMINRVVPGSTEQVYGDMGDSISASAKKSAGYNKGGLVQHFNNGGLVENMFGGAKTMFNMLPQVQAAKFVGGKAQGMFNRAKEFVGKPFDKSVNIPPPMGRKVKVITLPSKSSKNDSTNALIGSAQIPDFQVVHPARRSAKQKTLGITN